MDKQQKADTIVVGGGIAGLTSAAYLAKAGQEVILFEKEKYTGGLVNSFYRDGVLFDGGIRSIENSGIVFPMLKQLGIKVDFVRSVVSIGIEKDIIKVENKESLVDYENFLKKHFPGNKGEIEDIIKDIRKIMKYMDILYGINNPAFLDIKKDRGYFIKKILPWLFRYIFTVGKIGRIQEPVDEYLEKFTKSRQLNDIISQHFFRKTPAFFAMSYFSLYLDYYYPKGGTSQLVKKIEDFIIANGGKIITGTMITSLDPEEKTVSDDSGNRYSYKSLVWAADQKLLYNIINTDNIKDDKIAGIVKAKREELKVLEGGDSVLSLYLTADLPRSYFENICTGHFFYTPDKTGLSRAGHDRVNGFINGENTSIEKVKEYLKDFCELNTYEISIPSLRDPGLAPEGKTGLVISLLFDYKLAKRIEESGWQREFKDYIENKFVEVLDRNIFPGLQKAVSLKFSSTPVSVERITGNTGGAITGWAFTNPVIPVVHKLPKIFSAVDNPLPDVFQAGQWTYSPAGIPISILTGKLASDRALNKSFL